MIDYAPLVFRVDAMRPEDISRVMEIEHVSFSAPWSARAYDYELRYNEMARYFVARPQDLAYESGVQKNQASGAEAEADARSGQAGHRSLWRRLLGEPKEAPVKLESEVPIVGYGGFWLMIDEAHISTIAARPDWRRRGVGELLLVTMIDSAMEMGAGVVTLEVRVSNTGAQALYRKYGFEQVGLRKHYYSDNNEDALIMTTPHVTSAAYARKFQERKAALFRRLSR
jgi:ribosomal-protein-alanine N-acetyltransferase